MILFKFLLKTFCKHTYINETAWRKIKMLHTTVDGGYLWGEGCEKDGFFAFLKTKIMNVSATYI